MYSLVVNAQVGAWDRRGYDYPRDRFCEFSHDDLEERFRSLGTDAIEELKRIPTLFAYEGKTMDLRVGRITSITDRKNRVFFEFAFDERIAPIPFDTIEPAFLRLDISDWELSRTHWAVKNEDLISILADEGIIDRAFAF